MLVRIEFAYFIICDKNNLIVTLTKSRLVPTIVVILMVNYHRIYFKLIKKFRIKFVFVTISHCNVRLSLHYLITRPSIKFNTYELDYLVMSPTLQNLHIF